MGRSLGRLISTAPPVNVPTDLLASTVLSAAAALAVWTATRPLLRLDPAAALRIG